MKGEGALEGGIKGPSEEDIEIDQNLHENIKNLMTKEGYKKVRMKQLDRLNIRICAEKGYNSQVTDVVLGENIYEKDKDIDKTRYLYEAKIEYKSTDDSDKIKGVLSGAIELLEEKNEWKISFYTITEYPNIPKLFIRMD